MTPMRTALPCLAAALLLGSATEAVCQPYSQLLGADGETVFSREFLAAFATGLLLIVACVPLAGAAGQRESDSVRQAIEALMAPGGRPLLGLRVPPNDPRAAAIRTLETRETCCWCSKAPASNGSSSSATRAGSCPRRNGSRAATT